MLVAKSCLTFCNPMDCSPTGSYIHGILQARILEWVAISSFSSSKNECHLTNGGSVSEEKRESQNVLKIGSLMSGGFSKQGLIRCWVRITVLQSRVGRPQSKGFKESSGWTRKPFAWAAGPWKNQVMLMKRGEERRITWTGSAVQTSSQCFKCEDKHSFLFCFGQRTP